ncbi:unnamed protein product, partial [Didymodactylos carnosus]
QQCAYGEDEYSCDQLEFSSCSSAVDYRCRNGMCVDRAYINDGFFDCMDGSDEHRVEEQRFHTCDFHTSFECDNRLCSPEQASCGYGRCIHWLDEGSSTFECANHRDEISQCIDSEQLIPCKINGKCVPIQYYFDQKIDCDYGEDEDPSYYFNFDFEPCLSVYYCLLFNGRSYNVCQTYMKNPQDIRFYCNQSSLVKMNRIVVYEPLFQRKLYIDTMKIDTLLAQWEPIFNWTLNYINELNSSVETSTSMSVTEEQTTQEFYMETTELSSLSTLFEQKLIEKINLCLKRYNDFYFKYCWFDFYSDDLLRQLNLSSVVCVDNTIFLSPNLVNLTQSLCFRYDDLNQLHYSYSTGVAFDWFIRSTATTSSTSTSQTCSQYRCLLTGACISLTRLCDGYLDCSDRSDELNSTCSNVACSVDADSFGHRKYRCANGQCVSERLVGDGIQQCDDGSDEYILYGCSYSCRCSNSKPLQLAQICDGQQDCLDNGDEIGCADANPIIQHIVAQQNSCLPFRTYCDGYKHMPNAVDEMLCEDNQCSTGNRFQCRTGQCIPLSWKCDGFWHCTDGSDEYQCTPVTDLNVTTIGTTCNTSTELACYDGYGCVKVEKAGDGIVDCNDGSDERNRLQCTNGGFIGDRFRCDDGNCISRLWVCDSQSDCSSGSDEASCSWNQMCPNNLRPFRCLNKTNNESCVREIAHCNGIQDCFGGVDEQSCPFSSCTDNGESLCFASTGLQCVSNKVVCDGICDCGQCEDEQNCFSVGNVLNAWEQFANICLQLTASSVTSSTDRCFQDHCLTSGYDSYCGNGMCTKLVFLCDGIRQCPNGADELNCLTTTLTTTTTTTTASVTTISTTVITSAIYIPLTSESMSTTALNRSYNDELFVTIMNTMQYPTEILMGTKIIEAKDLDVHHEYTTELDTTMSDTILTSTQYSFQNKNASNDKCDLGANFRNCLADLQQTALNSPLCDPLYCVRGFCILFYDLPVCLCSPPYYGSRCQYYSSYVSVIFKLDCLLNSERFAWASMFVLLMCDDIVIDSIYYDVVDFQLLNDKTTIYLLMSRPKPLSMTNCYVQFEMYDYSEAVVSVYAEWSFPLNYPFLPVNRIAIVLRSLLLTNISVCKYTACVNGVCSALINSNSSFCFCSPGWYGRWCDKFINQCESSPCSSESTCRANYYPLVRGGGYTCLCPPGRFGRQCLLKNLDCESNPCQNFGICLPRQKISGYMCNCPMEFYGPMCQYSSTQLTIRIQNLKLNNTNEQHLVLLRAYDTVNGSLLVLDDSLFRMRDQSQQIPEQFYFPRRYNSTVIVLAIFDSRL